MMLVAGFQARCHPLCIIIIITGLLVYYIIIIIITLQLVKLNRLSKSNVILLLHIAYTHILGYSYRTSGLVLTLCLIGYLTAARVCLIGSFGKKA